MDSSLFKRRTERNAGTAEEMVRVRIPVRVTVRVRVRIRVRVSSILAAKRNRDGVHQV